MDSWFVVPPGKAGDAIEEVIIVLPVKGPIRVSAQHIADGDAEVDKCNDYIRSKQEKTGYIYHGLYDGFRHLIERYEGIASEALHGANLVRDDMVAYLRSVVFVLESVVGEHLNHSQKNERIRGAMGVLERHLHSLRDEKFTFRDSIWRRDPDLFRFNERERYLRQKIADLEAKLAKHEDTPIANRVETSEVPF